MLSNSAGGALNIIPSTDIIKGISRVLVDGQEIDSIIINGNDITIAFPAGAEKIEVIGTFVIPEFGPIATVILAISIIGIIFMSGRYKGFVSPKI
jgi:predicted secreted protein with PEFG-CTERM motif